MGLAEHDANKSDVGGLSYSVKHDVCFVLDPAKKRKKAWIFFQFIVIPVSACQCQVSAVTFGTQVAFQKLRASKNVSVLWRLRRVFFTDINL